jgi:hypothetical protein
MNNTHGAQVEYTDELAKRKAERKALFTALANCISTIGGALMRLASDLRTMV